MTRPRALLLVAAAAALPRLAVLLVERGDVLAAFTEKSDDFAQTLVGHGDFGFVPGQPSAYTQPLYGWFLAAVYWLVGRSWLSVGLTQVAVAVASALLVYELGRRFLSPRAGLVGALVFALNPYLVWHDVHVNREILDTLLAAALTLLVLAAAGRRSVPVAAAAGAVAGLAVLGNARLAFLPLVLAAFLLWRLGVGRRPAVAAAALVLASGAVVAPWLARNAVVVGCPALTTDARALWKANNEHTYETLARGGWIDDVPPLPGAPFNPEETAVLYRQTGRVVRADECAQMRLYQGEVLDFWREQPGEKARLAAQAAGMLWDPRVTRAEDGRGGLVGVARTWGAPLYFVPLFLLAVLGLAVAPRRFVLVAGLLLAYVTVTALVFAGATRYRAPWDFLPALLAGAALVQLVARRPE